MDRLVNHHALAKLILTRPLSLLIPGIAVDHIIVPILAVRAASGTSFRTIGGTRLLSHALTPLIDLRVFTMPLEDGLIVALNVSFLLDDEGSKPFHISVEAIKADLVNKVSHLSVREINHIPA